WRLASSSALKMISRQRSQRTQRPSVRTVFWGSLTISLSSRLNQVIPRCLPWCSVHCMAGAAEICLMDDKDGLIGASWMTEAPDDGSMGMAIIQGLQARENEMKRDNKAIVRGFADEVITQGKIEA